MKRSVFVLSSLSFVLGCSSKEEEGRPTLKFESSNDVVPANSPPGVDRVLEGLVEREKGTVLGFDGYFDSSGEGTISTLRWLYPDGTTEPVALPQADSDLHSPLIARDRKTLFFPDGEFEQVGTTVMSLTETAHTDLKPWIAEWLSTNSSTDHQLDFSRDGRFLTTLVGTSYSDSQWALIDSHTLEILWRATESYSSGSPEFLRGNVFNVDIYVSDWHTDQNVGEDTGARFIEEFYRGQLTDQGLVEAVGAELGANPYLDPSKIGADGSVWAYYSDAFLEQYGIYYSKKPADEAELIYDGPLAHGPFVVGNGSMALLLTGRELVRLTAKGDTEVLRDDIEPSSTLVPFFDGVIADIAGGGQAFIDQTGASTDVTFDRMFAVEHLETGHLSRFKLDPLTTTLFGMDSNGLSELSISNAYMCNPKDNAYPIGKLVYRSAEWNELILVVVTGTAPKEALRLTATPGYAWECPRFSVDATTLIASESAAEQPVVLHHIDWTGTSASVTSTNQWADLEYFQPLVAF